MRDVALDGAVFAQSRFQLFRQMPERRMDRSYGHSRLDRITAFSNTMNCSICVVNDANYAGLGLDGEGYTSFSIATPTGEGMTTARTFCRERRLAVCGGGLSRM